MICKFAVHTYGLAQQIAGHFSVERLVGVWVYARQPNGPLLTEGAMPVASNEKCRKSYGAARK
jgi:hypothetical protein